MDEKFWLNNPSVLFNNYIKFIPTYEMSRIEQLNAITRFCLYYIILLLLLNKGQNYLGIPIIIILFTIIIFYIYDNDNKSKYEDFINKKIYKGNKNNKKITNKIDILESGYYDMDGKLILGTKYDLEPQDIIDAQAKDFVNYDYNDILRYEKNSCKRPTKENPFMNPIVTDFGKDDIPVACNVDDQDIKESIERNFNEGLFRDLDDLYDTKNSQRVWYTIPSPAIPNDQDGFANWLYKTDGVCKTNQQSCLRYEDLRYKR